MSSTATSEGDEPFFKEGSLQVKISIRVTRNASGLRRELKSARDQEYFSHKAIAYDGIFKLIYDGEETTFELTPFTRIFDYEAEFLGENGSNALTPGEFVISFPGSGDAKTPKTLMLRAKSQEEAEIWCDFLRVQIEDLVILHLEKSAIPVSPRITYKAGGRIRGETLCLDESNRRFYPCILDLDTEGCLKIDFYKFQDHGNLGESQKLQFNLGYHTSIGADKSMAAPAFALDKEIFVVPDLEAQVNWIEACKVAKDNCITMKTIRSTSDLISDNPEKTKPVDLSSLKTPEFRINRSSSVDQVNESNTAKLLSFKWENSFSSRDTILEESTGHEGIGNQATVQLRQKLNPSLMARRRSSAFFKSTVSSNRLSEAPTIIEDSGDFHNFAKSLEANGFEDITDSDTDSEGHLSNHKRNSGDEKKQELIRLSQFGEMKDVFGLSGSPSKVKGPPEDSAKGEVLDECSDTIRESIISRGQRPKLAKLWRKSVKSNASPLFAESTQDPSQKFSSDNKNVKANSKVKNNFTGPAPSKSTSPEGPIKVTADFTKGEKTLFISADMITSEVITLFLGKIGLGHDAPQNYLLFEVDHKSSRMLDIDESPLLSKMNWEAEDDKRFILKRAKNTPVPSSSSPVASNGNPPPGVTIYCYNGHATNLKFTDYLTTSRASEMVCTDLKLARSSYEIFSIWAIGSDFELQLEGHHLLKKIYNDWPIIEQRFSEQHVAVTSPSTSPPRCKFEFRRWAFASKYQDIRVQDPIALNLLFCEAVDRVLKGKYPVERDDALKLAALQLQWEQGDYVAQSLNINGLLPIHLAKASISSKKLINHYQGFAGYTRTKCALEYLHLLIPMPFYGSTYFHAVIPPILSDDAFDKSLGMMGLRSNSLSHSMTSPRSPLSGQFTLASPSGSSVGATQAAGPSIARRKGSISETMDQTGYTLTHPEIDRQVYVAINVDGVQLIKKSNSSLILSIPFKNIKSYEISKQKTAFFIGYVEHLDGSAASQKQVLLQSLQASLIHSVFRAIQEKNSKQAKTLK